MNESNAALFVRLLKEGETSKEKLYELLLKITDSHKTFYEFVNYVVDVYGRVNFYERVKAELVNLKRAYSLCYSIQVAFSNILRYDWGSGDNYWLVIWDIFSSNCLTLTSELFYICFPEFVNEMPEDKSFDDYWWDYDNLSPRIECVNNIIEKLKDKGE